MNIHNTFLWKKELQKPSVRDKRTYALMDYHLTWYKCCPHWDDVQWPRHGSIPQTSRSHRMFKHACVSAITYVCFDGFPSNLAQMSSLRRFAYIQEYLGYQSNNLYFLFSHSWPVVVYTFGQVQRTSQVERKTKCSKKTKHVIYLFWSNGFQHLILISYYRKKDYVFTCMQTERQTFGSIYIIVLNKLYFWRRFFK